MVNSMDYSPGRRPNGVWRARFSEKFVNGRGRRLQNMCAAKLKAKEFEQRFILGKLRQDVKNITEGRETNMNRVQLSANNSTQTNVQGHGRSGLLRSVPDNSNSLLKKGVLGYVKRIQTSGNRTERNLDARDPVDNVQSQFEDSETDKNWNVRGKNDFNPGFPTPEGNKQAQTRFQNKYTNFEKNDQVHAFPKPRNVSRQPTPVLVNGNPTPKPDEKSSTHRTRSTPSFHENKMKGGYNNNSSNFKIDGVQNQKTVAQKDSFSVPAKGNVLSANASDFKPQGWIDWEKAVVAPAVSATASKESLQLVEENDDLSDPLVDTYVQGWNSLENIKTQGVDNQDMSGLKISEEKLLRMTTAKSTTNNFTLKVPPGTISQPPKTRKEKYGGYEIDAVAQMGWGDTADTKVNWYDDGCGAWSSNDGGPVWG